MNKEAILVVSFGTSYINAINKSIEAIENKIKSNFNNYEVRRAFTSQFIINKIKNRDNIIIDNVSDAMDKLIKDGFKKVIVQPTHVISGYEYNKIIELINPYKDKLNILYGKPLITSNKDYEEVAEIIIKNTKDYNNKENVIVFMGHGTKHNANIVYENLNRIFIQKGYNNYFVGTVEAIPSLQDILTKTKEFKAKKVVLFPLMIVSGDHVINDMSSDRDGSWKSEFKKMNIYVECVLKGLGEYDKIQDIFVRHIKEAC